MARRTGAEGIQPGARDVRDPSIWRGDVTVSRDIRKILLSIPRNHFGTSSVLLPELIWLDRPSPDDANAREASIAARVC